MGKAGTQKQTDTLTAYKGPCAKLQGLVAQPHHLACQTGFEPAAAASLEQCSIRLSYQHAEAEGHTGPRGQGSVFLVGRGHGML